MIGIAGSGKTTLAGTAFPDHVHVSLDRIRNIPKNARKAILDRYVPCGTRESEERMMENVLICDALSRDRNVLVDDTNLTGPIRKRHIETGRRYGAAISCIFFQNMALAYARNEKRHRRLDRKVLDTHHAKLEPPNRDEGFDFVQIMY